MRVQLRSFGKINLGLKIGPRREDGYHELETVYQTIALHDVITVETGRGSGVRLQCSRPDVPLDENNTCFRMTQQVMHYYRKHARVLIDIEKRLPSQGGLGAASSNAVAVLLGLERAMGRPIPLEAKLRLAAAVGSDVPLFLLGGTVAGVGRGEAVFPLHDLKAMPCLIATPRVGVSTPRAFRDWDARETKSAGGRTARTEAETLTQNQASDKIRVFSQSVCSWLRVPVTGVSAGRGGRAEALLLDLVRTGIENDFEKVVFPQYPALRKVKRVLEKAGAQYASLSGSGSSIYGLFSTTRAAERAAKRLLAAGIPARATRTLERQEYWKRLFVD